MLSEGGDVGAEVDLGVLGLTCTLLEQLLVLPKSVFCWLTLRSTVPPVVVLSRSGFGGTDPTPALPVGGVVRLVPFVGLLAPPKGGGASPGVDPSMFEMTSERRAKSSVPVLDLRGFVVILLVGKAVRPHGG